MPLDLPTAPPRPPDSPSTVFVLLACVLVATSAFALPAAAASVLGASSVQAADTEIRSVEYTGDRAVPEVNGDLYIWQSGPHRFAVTVSTDDGFDDGSLCLTVESDGTNHRLDCRTVSVGAGSETVAVPVEEWPANATGSGTVRATLNASGSVSTATLSLVVITEDGDLDGDGLANQREVALGTGLRSADTDGDGLSDGSEVETYESSPTDADTDGDGLDDGEEVETHGTDPTEPDSDGDGLPDPEELSIGTNPTANDTDGDRLSDGKEVNTYDTDPEEPDTDGDGLDDGAEVLEYESNPEEPDTDGDGLDDNLEVNTYETDPTMIDTDGDGLEDGIEVEEHDTDPADADTDGDGLSDGKEVNTYDTDPTNPDTDGDGLEDGPEVNEYGTDPTDPDTDSDGIGDAGEVDQSRFGDVPLSTNALLGLAGLAVAVLGFAVWLGRDRLARLPPLRRRHAGADEGRATAGDSEADAASTDETAAGQSPSDRASTDGQPDAGEVPPEFLSNEERVLALVDEHDGRIRQAELVEETDWSKSKVSRVLSEMEEDGQIIKIDVGRGNVVTRPDELPSGAQSPFDR